MPTVEVSVVCSAPIQAVWQAIKQFDSFAWATPKDDTPIKIEIINGQAPDSPGAVRVLHLPDGSKLTETLLAMSNVDHSYEYTITSGPFPVSNHRAKLQLLRVSDTDETFVNWTAKYDSTVDDEAATKAAAAAMTARFAARLANCKNNFKKQ